jgi:hypothetical protein
MGVDLGVHDGVVTLQGAGYRVRRSVPPGFQLNSMSLWRSVTVSDGGAGLQGQTPSRHCCEQ